MNVDLESYKTDEFFLVSEWVINIQVPALAAEDLAKALSGNLTLVQGNYSCCMYIRRSGDTRFKANRGAYGGVESTIQSVESCEIIISIPQEEAFLKQVLKTIQLHHVHEEPTVRITPAHCFRSAYNSDNNNPNKYWNRLDRDELHGEAI